MTFPIFMTTLCAVSIAGLAFADPVPERDPVFVLEPLVIRDRGLETPPLALPASVTRLDRDDIQKASAQLSINESLQTVPGVFALNPYNYAQDSRIAIRGFGARSDFGIRGIRLVVDGIPATLPDGQGGVDGIDLGSTGEMEIIRGPAAAIYGPASGGVIRIKTEEAPAVPFTELRLLGGSYGLFKSQFKAGYAEGPWNVLVSGTHFDYQGYREKSQTENTSLNTRIGYAFEDGSELTTVIQAIDYPVQDDPGGLTAAEVEADRRQARARNLQFDGGEQVRQQKLGFAYRRPLSDAQSLHVHAFLVNRDFANKLPFTDGGQVGFERFFGGMGARYAFGGEKLRWVVGAEVGRQDDARKNYDNLDGERGPVALEQDEVVTNVGSFVASEWAVSDQLSLSAALRYDEVHFDVDDDFLSDGDDSGKRTFRETSPMLGLLWAPRPELSFFANWTTSFETPTTTELDNPAGGGFNSALGSQTAQSLEFGLIGRLPNAFWRPKLELTVFSIDVEDALVPYEVENFPGRDFFRNAGSTRKEGLEALLALQPTERLSAVLSYTYSDFRYKDFDSPGGDYGGNRLPGVPEHFGNLRIDYRHPSGFSAIWNTRFVGALQADDANTTEISGYSFSDLRLSWEHAFGDWTFEAFAGVNNLFDQDYSANIRINAFGGRYYEPALGRNGYAGLRLRYSFGQ
ncbi:TonB-dependent receptor [Coraliomargarita sinensis]|uniref:TonB-dependent receptor n=1 Tax=Coraliomargarita sinensis TaxID=2174842 RepID=A0A317ZNU9_9BACT|nr:TonB-dependent receptor [Coraliomargarita sinensis]PXA05539.1 TonB-dependent receptor [Coraliomargarita sinensis]